MYSDAVTMAALRDIERHVRMAPDFTKEIDFEAFEKDTRTMYAVVRCLEINSEASRRLSQELKDRNPSIRWKEMAPAGNVYRHEYEDVAAKLVWHTVEFALPPLMDVVKRALDSA